MIFLPGLNAAAAGDKPGKMQSQDYMKRGYTTMTGRKGYVDGVYVICVSGYPKIRFWWFSARNAEKEYRQQFGLKGKHISWTKALY